MHQIRPYLPSLLIALLLSGCAMQAPEPEQETPQQAIPPVLTKPLPAMPHASELEYPDAMLSVPKTRDYNWDNVIHPMINNLLQATTNMAAGVLLLNAVNNLTNGALAADKASEVLYNALAGNRKFTLASTQQVLAGRQQLGLSSQDKLASRSKALSIARSVGSQYLLYTTVSGSAETPSLQMQLLLVQSGEIIWSDTGAVQQQ